MSFTGRDRENKDARDPCIGSTSRLRLTNPPARPSRWPLAQPMCPTASKLGNTPPSRNSFLDVLDEQLQPAPQLPEGLGLEGALGLLQHIHRFLHGRLQLRATGTVEQLARRLSH